MFLIYMVIWKVYTHHFQTRPNGGLKKIVDSPIILGFLMTLPWVSHPMGSEEAEILPGSMGAVSNVGFHKWGIPKWLVYSGKSYKHG